MRGNRSVDYYSFTANFASDRESYDQAFFQFKNERRHEALGEQYFTEQFGSDHWQDGIRSCIQTFVSHHMRDCKTRLRYRLNDAPTESGYI